MGCCSSNNPSEKTNVSPTETTEEQQAIIEASDADKMSSTERFLETLKDIPLLSSLSEGDQRKLANELEERNFAIGENLMTQGDSGTEFFIILSGCCKVVVKNDDGAEVEIAQLNDGDYCGEQALMNDAQRGATVQASTNTTCLVLNQAAFKQITEESGVRLATRDAKRNAISAEMMDQFNGDQGTDESQRKGPAPSEEQVQWLFSCVAENILFSHLDEEQRLIVCNEMYAQTVAADEFLIKQGEEGNTFYVVETGVFDITVEEVGKVASLEAGNCVGELALLYNAPRAASVKCISSEGGSVWCVDRTAFRKALRDVQMAASNQNIEFLKKCELLQPLLSSELTLVDQALELEKFSPGHVIFNLGDEGNRFYIVKSGTVAGLAKDGTEFKLGEGAFFGERALLTKEPRAATITVAGKTPCECLTLSREDFNTLLGPLEDIMERNLEEYTKPAEVRKPIGHSASGAAICDLDAFKVVGILGRGAFGTVKLVTDTSTNESYALKAIKKNQVVELGQQSHILNEKKVMQMLDNPFLVNLKATYKDEFRVYFLLEVCLGGELFTILRKMRSFDEPTARFYGSCVVEAFDYMHARDIIYRDLKPENLVMTSSGYLKVTDFGFAKVVPNKTFTLCGTPDYLAPEIVTGQGHGKGVDWWTLGILIYEMLASFPPFFDDEPMMTYRKIIQGKFKFPRYLSAQSKDIITKLLKPKSTKRLGVVKGGAKLIRAHPWFKDFAWTSLQNQTLKPPIKNKVKSHDDLSNFDHFQEKNEDLTYKGDADLGWDDEF